MEKLHPNWNRIRSEYGRDLKLFRVRWDEMENLRNGTREQMIILEMGDSVNVIALTDEEQYVFVQQFRFGLGVDSLELPGGLIDKGESPLEAARRELEEETGYTGGDWEYLGSTPSNSVFIQGRIHHWMARGVAATQVQKLDSGEAIEVRLLSKDELRAGLDRHEIDHPHTLSALLRSELFVMQ